MPYYEYKCEKCGYIDEVYQPIGEYSRAPQIPSCCEQPMERHFSGGSGPAGLNAQFGDRHYQDMIATDGTPVDSRTKHREYMRRNGLTTADDFRESWKKDHKEREKFRRAEHTDRELKETLAQEVYTRINRRR